MKLRAKIFWLFLMAWRDGRVHIGRLLLFMASIVLGIAALVAINSFGDNLQKDIDNEAKELLGADLLIGSRKPAEDSLQLLLDSLAEVSIEEANEISFSSMAYFPSRKKTRLANIRALEGAYPFYGELETEPLEAQASFGEGKKALVDQTLLLQFDVKVGDKIKIGEVTFEILGALLKAPGQNNIASTVAPKVYIPQQYLEETGLVKKGSRLRYRYYYQFNPEIDVDALGEKIDPRLEAQEFGYDTVEERKADLGNAFSNLTSFLNLVAFVALLLGCVGVASAVQIYLRDKRSSIAILRCLGAKGGQSFWIYLIQILVMGLTGSLIGAFLGSGIQVLLPQVLKDFLPLEVNYSISWPAVGQGILVGCAISMLFALLPLLSIRKISPLRTLRASYEEQNSRLDIWQLLVYGLIGLFVFGFSYSQIRDLQDATYFSGFLLLAFVVLWGAAKLLMYLVRRFFPVSWSYIWRQSLANLYRPNNQTLVLIITVGLGTALLSTLYFIQTILLGQVALSDSNNQPNMILFDIQTDQTESIAQLTRDEGLEIRQMLPIVAMRLAAFNGETRAELDAKDELPGDVLFREYRVTYRDTLDINETLVEGSIGKPVSSPDDPVQVTISETHARRMKAKVGDEIVFNVQGALIKTVISGIRRLDLTRFRTSFTFVFPSGVLEKAPQFHVLITRVNSTEKSADFQQKIVSDYPNISIVDISLILKTTEEILDEVTFVIRFMALFSILTGILVLIGSVMITRFQRIQESVLLRTLGANRKQIIYITVLEYLFLGSLATLAGILLALLASWGLTTYIFNIDFNPDYSPILFIYLGITGLTGFIGMLSTRGVLNRPPLEVLRNEA